MPHNIAILGASGYTGAELVRLISTHPSFRIVALSGDRKAGQPMSEVYPHLRHMDLPDLSRIEDIDFSGVDLVISAKSATDEPRRPGVVGLYLRIAIVLSSFVPSRRP